MGATGSKTTTTPAFDQIKSVKKSIGGRSKNISICLNNNSYPNNKAVSSSTEKSPRFLENTILVWLDGSLGKPSDSDKKSLDQIRRITNILETFSELEKCFDFIKSIKDEKIFLIVSGSFGPQIVPRIETFNQVNSIFIYCGNKANHIEWTKQYKKIKSIHTQIRELCEAVKYNIRQYDKSLTSITILPSSDVIELNKSNQEFIYLQVLKCILLEMRYDKKSEKQFIEYSRQFYLNNEYQLNIIDTLPKMYELHSPIWWYTRRSSMYAMLRKAFSTNDFEVILKLAFFIRDVHRDIKKSHSQLHDHQHHVIDVYRATRVTMDEFTNIEKNRDGLIAFNDFVLTTLERSMALKFANFVRDDPNSVAIIYKIHIDPITSTMPYISLNNLSYLSNTEGEILFSMNTIFNIYKLDKLNDRLYELSLVPTSKKNQQIKNLIEYIQAQTANVPGWYKLTKIMMDTNEYDLIESIYNYIYDQTEQTQFAERAFLQHELGYINELKDNLPISINHYKQAIDIYLKYIPATHPTLLSTYTNLGSVLQKQGDFSGALVYYQNALKIEQPNDPNIVVQYNNIGTTLQQQGKYAEAEQTYEKAVQTLIRDFPSAHSLLADTYHNMAGLFYLMKNYSKALTYYEKTLAIEEKTPPILASTYFNIATTYEGLGDYKQSIKYAEKAVETARLTFGNEHLETKENLNYLERLRQKS